MGVAKIPVPPAWCFRLAPSRADLNLLRSCLHSSGSTSAIGSCASRVSGAMTACAEDHPVLQACDIWRTQNCVRLPSMAMRQPMATKAKSAEAQPRCLSQLSLEMRCVVCGRAAILHASLRLTARQRKLRGQNVEDRDLCRADVQTEPSLSRAWQQWRAWL